MPARKRLVILGSTGSIGTSALEVTAAMPERFEVVGLSAHSNLELLRAQVRQFAPRWVTLTADQTGERDIAAVQSASGRCEWLYGDSGIRQMVQHPDVDLVLVAIVGAAGLTGTLAAVEAGKSVALANKEALVMAGQLVTETAARTGAQLLPVDSEHSAIFQILSGRDASAVERIVLTASGGPFRGRSRAQLEQATIEEALQHPTWRMGPKITVDSATLMNKALEVIEARWLFGLTPEQIQVVIHPESIIHSLVEFCDGSILAQVSPPDMRLPIQYALTWPERVSGPARRLDWSALRSWTFEKPDVSAFPALELGYDVARRGGTCGAVLNAANEAAVGRFLAGTLRFTDITPACRDLLEAHAYRASCTLAELLAMDRWAREEVARWKAGSSATWST